MKGIFVHNKREFRLEVAGESFFQGDTLRCTFSVKNHSPSECSLALLCDLGVADLKLLKAKALNAVTPLLEGDTGDPLVVKAQELKQITLSFVLDKNSVVSEKAQSLCFVLGDRDDVTSYNYLPITLNPHPHIQKIISLIESTFQFVPKGVRSASGRTEVKMKPPSSKKLTLVEELILALKFNGADLDVEYTFKVKSFDTTGNGLSVKKGKTSVKQRWPEKEYLLTPEHLNHERVEGKIEEALSVVSSAIAD